MSIKEDSAFGPGMMFGIPGPGPKPDRKPIPSDPKMEKGIDIKKKKMKNLKTFEDFIFESELNELKLTSYGVKELLSAIYYNWDKLKTPLKNDMHFQAFKDIIGFLKSGDQEEQTRLENFVKKQGIEVIKL
jgi:hypothetical protein